MAIRSNDTEREGPMSAAHRLLTLAIVSLITIIAFEAMAVSTAMPVVAEELGAVRSYGLAFSILLTGELLGIVASGVWSDRHGPLPPLYLGQALLALGSLVAGLAGSFPVLLTGRLVAGLGGGLIVVALYVVIGRAYPHAVRPQVFAWVSAAWVLPSLVGPPVAGVLTTSWSWRWVFLIVLAPIALTFVVVLAQRARIVGGGSAPDEAERHDAGGAPARRRVAGYGLGVAVAAGVMQVGAERLTPFNAWAVVATTLGVVGVLLTFPRLVPRGTARLARGLPSVMGSRFLLAATFNGSMTFVPLMLVSERGLTPGLAGLMLTIGALGWSLGSWIQGLPTFADRKPELISTGGLCLGSGVAVLAVVAAMGLHHVVVGVGAALAGLGMGLATSSTSVLSLALSPTREHGAAAASLNVSDVLGSVFGLSVSGAVFAALHDPVGSDVPVFILMWAVLAGLGCVVVVSGRRTRGRAASPAAGEESS